MILLCWTELSNISHNWMENSFFFGIFIYLFIVTHPRQYTKLHSFVFRVLADCNNEEWKVYLLLKVNSIWTANWIVLWLDVELSFLFCNKVRSYAGICLLFWMSMIYVLHFTPSRAIRRANVFCPLIRHLNSDHLLYKFSHIFIDT